MHSPKNWGGGREIENTRLEQFPKDACVYVLRPRFVVGYRYNCVGVECQIVGIKSTYSFT